MGWAVFKMLFALSLVLGLLFLLVRLLKQTPLVRKDLPADFGIRVLTTKPISPRKFISLVEIGGEVLAVGISDSQINYLTKIENPEWLEKWRAGTPPGPAGTLPACDGKFPVNKKKNQPLFRKANVMGKKSVMLFMAVLLTGWTMGLAPSLCWGQGSGLPIPALKIGLGEAKNPGEVSTLVQILLLLTVLSLAPAILIMMTSFTRLAVVFSFLRHAIGTQQMPPNQVLIGLSLFLTFFIMSPVWQTVRDTAWDPYMKKTLTQEQALEAAASRSGPLCSNKPEKRIWPCSSTWPKSSSRRIPKTSRPWSWSRPS